MQAPATEKAATPSALPRADRATGSSGRPGAALPCPPPCGSGGGLKREAGSGSPPPSPAQIQRRRHGGGRHELRRRCGSIAGNDGRCGTTTGGDGRGGSTSDDGGGGWLVFGLGFDVLFFFLRFSIFTCGWLKSPLYFCVRVSHVKIVIFADHLVRAGSVPHAKTPFGLSAKIIF